MFAYNSDSTGKLLVSWRTGSRGKPVIVYERGPQPESKKLKENKKCLLSNLLRVSLGELKAIDIPDHGQIKIYHQSRHSDSFVIKFLRSFWLCSN